MIAQISQYRIFCICTSTPIAAEKKKTILATPCVEQNLSHAYYSRKIQSCMYILSINLVAAIAILDS